MHPLHDIDALLLLALALASKRRPAELAEVIAAVDLLQGAIPSEAKLAESFLRLATNGLVCAEEGRVSLSTASQAIVTGLPKKADTAERIFEVRQRLAAHVAQDVQEAAMPTIEQLSAAILAHRASGQGTGKNLLMPKPKTPETERKRAGHWRKPLGAARRRKG
ncbi:hypothetical protein SAMN05421829_102417 [Aromatoleum tolulyticum]|uniref:Uncharacterized protein n=1 Tax=Aromatoleum tolulyticum TaxID=34027 RepID=A0A1N6QAU4_9RHOO|nr:hypothetical protein [Aromatoleum tolulyticum]SIQ13546.1 hypothetical protein SAMN05421829_102417 [Aromatoleum tolulyticum]